MPLFMKRLEQVAALTKNLRLYETVWTEGRNLVSRMELDSTVDSPYKNIVYKNNHSIRIWMPGPDCFCMANKNKFYNKDILQDGENYAWVFLYTG
jgi:hypothetical protein